MDVNVVLAGISLTLSVSMAMLIAVFLVEGKPLDAALMAVGAAAGLATFTLLATGMVQL